MLKLLGIHMIIRFLECIFRPTALFTNKGQKGMFLLLFDFDFESISKEIYRKTRIFSVDKFSSKNCQRAFATSIFRECVTVKNINKSNNINMLLEMQLPHE